MKSIALITLAATIASSLAQDSPDNPYLSLQFEMKQAIARANALGLL